MLESWNQNVRLNSGFKLDVLRSIQDRIGIEVHKCPLNDYYTKIHCRVEG